MNHSDIQSRMASYLDGELALDARALFDAHLDRCDACSRELAEMRDTIRLLRTLPNPEPPADLVNSVMRRIAEGEGQPDWLSRAMDQLSQVFVPRIVIPVTAVVAALTLTVMSGDLSLRSLDPRGWSARSELAAITLDVPGDASSAEAVPLPVRVARVERPARARARAPVTVHLAMPTPPLRQRSATGAGSFLFRVANDQLGPIRREPREGDVASRILFMSGSPRVGPYLGASTAPSIVLGSHPYIVGVGIMQPNSGESLGWGLTPVAASRPNPVPDGGPGEVSPGARRHLELNARLSFLTDDPPGFVHQQARLSLAERELWLQQLAVWAVEIGEVERVMNALEGSGDEVARDLARAFKLAVERDGENWAAAELSPASE